MFQVMLAIQAQQLASPEYHGIYECLRLRESIIGE